MVVLASDFFDQYKGESWTAEQSFPSLSSFSFAPLISQPLYRELQPRLEIIQRLFSALSSLAAAPSYHFSFLPGLSGEPGWGSFHRGYRMVLGAGCSLPSARWAAQRGLCYLLG